MDTSCEREDKMLFCNLFSVTHFADKSEPITIIYVNILFIAIRLLYFFSKNLYIWK